MSLLELNVATGLRAELESIKNKSLLVGAGIAMKSILDLQNKISNITPELSFLERTKSPIKDTKPKEKEKDEKNNDDDNDKNENEPKKDGDGIPPELKKKMVILI